MPKFRKIDNMGQVYSQIRVNSQKKKPGWSTKNKIYASNLGCKCDWLLRFKFLDTPEDSDKFIWDGYEAEIGNAIHDLVQNDAISEGILKAKEVWAPITISGIKINCRLDGIFIDNRIVEYKTIGVKDEKEVQKAPKKDHVVQGNFYLGAKKVNTIMITYLSRDRGKHIATWEFDFDKDLFDKTIDKIKRVVEGKDLIKNKSECHFCPYKRACGGVK